MPLKLGIFDPKFLRSTRSITPLLQCLLVTCFVFASDTRAQSADEKFEILIWTHWENKKQAAVSILRDGSTTTRELGLIKRGTSPLAITNASRSRLVVRYTLANGKNDEVVVFALPGLQEMGRHPMGLQSKRKISLEVIRPDLFEISGDQEQMVTLAYQDRRWRLHTLELNADSMLQTLELPKNVLIGRVFPKGNHIAIASAKTVNIIDLKKLAVVSAHNFARKAYFDLIFDPDKPMLHVLERLKEKLWRDPRSFRLRNRERVTLISIDAITGNQQTKPLGFEAPIVISHPDNNSIYLAAKASPKPSSDLKIWRLANGTSQLVHRIPNERDPFSLFVYEPADRIVLFYISTEDLVLELSSGEQLGTLKTPVKPSVDPVVRDQRYVYLTSAIGSNVSLVDLKEATELAVVATGRTEIKIFQGALSVLGMVAAQAYGIGFTYLDFASARTRLNYDADKNQVLVLNTGTNDISVLNAQSLEVQGHLPVGSGAIGMFNVKDSNAVVTLAAKRLTTVDQLSVTEISAVTNGELAGLNAIDQIAYFRQKKVIKRFSLEDGREISQLEMPGRVLLVSGPTGSRSTMETFDVPALVPVLTIGYGPNGLRMGGRSTLIRNR